MPFILLALFICVPLIEIALFITVGQQIGLLWTILIVIITAIIGTGMVQQQGLSAIQRGQEEMNSGRMPVGPMRDGFFLFGAGALLLTPGFLTDALGFALLIPPLRQKIAAFLIDRVMKRADIKVETATFGGPTSGSGTSGRAAPPPNSPPPGKGPVIDGEFSEVTPDRSTTPDDARSDDAAKASQRDGSPWRR